MITSKETPDSLLRRALTLISKFVKINVLNIKKTLNYLLEMHVKKPVRLRHWSHGLLNTAQLYLI